MKRITGNEINEAIIKVMESDFGVISDRLSHIREGDEDDGSDDGMDDGSGDDGSDDGGDDGSDGGESSSSEEKKDPEDEINKLSDRVAQGFNAPKNLTLADGTQTHIATDSNDQIGEADQDTDNFEVKFEKGNWDSFSTSAQLYSQKVTTIRQTFIPLLEKSMIELLENSGAYDRKSFNVSASYRDDKFVLIVELHYQVDLWLGTEFEPEWIQHDQGYIFQTLVNVPNVKVESVKIDSSIGDLQVIATF